MRLLNSSLYYIPVLNNKSINNVSFEASATMASHRPEYETSMKMRDRGKGKEETSISWKFSLKKESFVHRVKIFERKKNKFQTRGSIISIPVLRFFYSVSLFHIRRMNYRKEESNIGEPSITGSLNKDVANTFTNLRIFHYIPLYSKEGWNISSTYLERQQSLTRRCTLE